MTLNTKDFEGKKFGRLTIVSTELVYKETLRGSQRETLCSCICECGGTKEVSLTALRRSSGSTKSCGCLHREVSSKLVRQHGRTGTKTHTVWSDIIARCTKEYAKSYKNYGGRGIPVCDRWLEPEGQGFINFLDDMGEVPSENHSIERKDVNSGYSPSNCIWTDDNSLQSYNTRLRITNTTGKTGVSEFTDRKGVTIFLAQISKDKKRRRKNFSSFEQAAKQRDAWEIELYGFNHCNTR